MLHAMRNLRWVLAAVLIPLALQAGASAPAGAQSGSVVVIRQFGAALRYAPSSDADIFYTASCGDTFPVVDSRSGWYEVYASGSYVWVGGARVADAAAPPRFSCAGARTFQIGDQVFSRVQTGCLSLRYTPSRNAGYDYCVDNGHRYTVENGPIEVSGEDWFELWSPSTGDGWSLAEFLYAAP